MKLQQLRYIWEVARNNLNVSQTAQSLFTSQPGISKQIRLLEDELGVEIFARNGKHLTRVTPAGKQIIDIAGEMLGKVDKIKNIAQECTDEDRGKFTIATTQTISRYAMPSVVRQFLKRYPNVLFEMHEGSHLEISQMVLDGRADIGIFNGSLDEHGDVFEISCYKSSPCIVTKPGHPIGKFNELTLEEIAAYPLVTYSEGLPFRVCSDRVFFKKGLVPRIASTAQDVDAIKAYVRLGLGIGLLVDIAISNSESDLVAIDASHLFGKIDARVGFRKETFLRSYMYDFIQMYAPHMTREVIDSKLLGTKPMLMPEKLPAFPVELHAEAY